MVHLPGGFSVWEVFLYVLIFKFVIFAPMKENEANFKECFIQDHSN